MNGKLATVLCCFGMVIIGLECKAQVLREIASDGNHLFYEQFAPAVLDRWRIEGATFAVENGRLMISAVERFKLTVPMNRDVSGWSGFELKLNAESPLPMTWTLECTGMALDTAGTVSMGHWIGTEQTGTDEGTFRFPFNSLVPYDEATSAVVTGNLPFVGDIQDLTLIAHPPGPVRLEIAALRPFGSRGPSGPSVAFDMNFAPYRNIPLPDLAMMILDRGFVGVNMIYVGRTGERQRQRDILSAFHEAGLHCSVMLFPTTDFAAYDKHPDWRQVMLDGTGRHDWRVYLCPNNDRYREYYLNELRDLLRESPYDGIQLSEPWFEVWGGPALSNPNRGKYACVCEQCRRKFQALADVDPLALFDPGSPQWFAESENDAVYQKWVDFRVESINAFCRQILETAREVLPGITTSSMILSDVNVELNAGRAYQAQDLEYALRVLQPDVMVIQDAWQDWTQPRLSPLFVNAYAKEYVPRALAVKPDLILHAHADGGSQSAMRRTNRWMREFSLRARAGGFSAPRYYEFSLPDYSR